MLTGIGFCIDEINREMGLSKKIKQFVVGATWVFVLMFLFIGCIVLSLIGSIKIKSY